MYIERVEIYGFKSFARKTELVFGPGLCVVMGPNGVGKSNILDAIRWAVGEQKLSLLRSSVLEDVIFDGSAGMKPANFAEVSIQFADAEGLLPYDPKADRIKITRRAYRDGDSKFFINGAPMRLKDIRGILSVVGLGDVGYAVMNETMINRIINGSTEDRRMLFEQAAGIAKYKADKKATEQKLKATQESLTRLEDILRELSEQEAILRRQVNRYKRYQKLRGEIRELEKIYYGAKLAELKIHRAEILSKIEEKENVNQRISAEIASLSSEIQKLIAQRREIETRRESVFQEKNKVSTEIAEKEQQIAVLQERIKHARSIIDNFEANSARLKRTIENSKREIENAEKLRQIAQKKIAEIEAEIKELEEKIGALSQENLARKNEIAQLEKSWEQLRTRINQLDNKIGFARQENEKLSARLREYEEQIARRRQTVEQLRAQVENLRTRLTELTEQRQNLSVQAAELENIAGTLENEIARLRDEVEHLEREKASATGQLSQLEKIVLAGEDIGKTVAKIAREPEKYGVLGVVADMIDTSPEYSELAERILGERVRFFVVRTAEEALKAVEKFPQDAGEIGFVILNELNPDAPAPEWANTRYPELRELLVCNVSEETAQAQETPIITPNGKILRRRGEIKIRLGKGAPGAITIRARISRLRKHLSQIEADLKTKRDELSELSQKFNETSSKLKSIRAQIGEIGTEISKIERELAKVSERYENYSRSIDELSSAREEINSQIERNIENIKQWEGERDELDRQFQGISRRKQEIQNEIEQANSTIRELENHLSAKTIERVNAENDIRNAENEIARAKIAIQRAEEQLAQLSAEAKNAREVIERSQKEINELKKAVEQLFRQQDELTRQGDELVGQINELSRRIARLREQNSKLSAEREQVQVQIAQLRGQLEKTDALIAQIGSEAENNLGEIPEEGEILPEPELQKIQTKILNKKRQLEQYGGADEEIVEQYEQVKKRLEFLNEQKEDVLASISDLKATIRRLDAEARKLFMETFERAREKFKEVFAQLFEDGEADIALVDPDSPLTSDISIKVKPAGKKTLSLSQLSAGEKALTALALLFGLYLVKPAPFCMMDEVDAPLDDANVERFLKLVRSFSKQIQFIIISHNSRTLERADYLYGVSMEKDGVSRVFSVKMSDLQLQFE